MFLERSDFKLKRSPPLGRREPPARGERIGEAWVPHALSVRDVSFWTKRHFGHAVFKRNYIYICIC